MKMAKQGFVEIHGKAYETVASRVARFREFYPEYTIQTKIIKIDADECIVEASILNEESRLIANGHAQEFRANSQINRTSYVENCETSAIGRALAAFGIGGTEFASANEVVNAIHQQKQPEQKQPTINIQALIKQITDTKSLDDLLKAFKDVYPKVQNDAAATKQIIAAKDEMKSLFEGESK
jgi:uncharacterized membrane protein affecting hemolysin expression